MSGTIVVGADGTEPSRTALRWALERGSALGSTVLLIHVFDDEWATLGARATDDFNDDARRLLGREADYARSVAADVDVRFELLRGGPMEELARFSSKAHLIVVGTHKTGYVHGKVFGSRSLQLAVAARCPVAIIPQPAVASARGVLVGVDDTPAGSSAVRFAAAEASRTDQELTLIRAWSSPRAGTDPDDFQAEYDSLIDKNETRILADAATTMLREYPRLTIRRRGIRRAPAEALLDGGASSRMLVVGSTRRTGAEQMGLGTVTHDVLLNLAGPTVVVHDGDAPARLLPGMGAMSKTPDRR